MTAVSSTTIEAIKNKTSELCALLDSLGPSREFHLARLRIEQAIGWAIAQTAEPRVEFRRDKYGCFNRPFNADICHHHHDDPLNRLDPKCMGCDHQMRPWREMGRREEASPRIA